MALVAKIPVDLDFYSDIFYLGYLFQSFYY